MRRSASSASKGSHRRQRAERRPDKNNPNVGDDAQSGEYKDMVKAGILGNRNMPGWADAGDVGRLRHGEKGIPQTAHVRPR